MCALYVHHNMVEYRILINIKRVEMMIVRRFHGRSLILVKHRMLFFRKKKKRKKENTDINA